MAVDERPRRSEDLLARKQRSESTARFMFFKASWLEEKSHRDGVIGQLETLMQGYARGLSWADLVGIATGDTGLGLAARPGLELRSGDALLQSELVEFCERCGASGPEAVAIANRLVMGGQR